MEMGRVAEWSSNSAAASSSTAASSSASSSSSFSSAAAAGVDRMVRVELEAAEALADLAHLAMREGGGSPSKWGSKGKRAKKRVKSESPPPPPTHHSALNTVLDSVQDLPPDQPAAEDFQQQQPVCGSETIAISPVKPEKSADLLHKRCGARSFPPFGGGRSRQVLTEAEKEARRLRRILANRESARQTIRRRQALCEELTRKAACLAVENENLKREKELALKEQESLETTNRQLKSQMAKAIKAVVVEEAGVELKQSWFQMPNHHQPANCQMLFYNQHAFAPFCWPPIVQSQEAQETSTNTNARTSLYLMSCPWFLPVADNSANAQHHPQSSHDFKHFHNVVATTVDDQCSGGTSIPQKVESEAAEVMVIDDLNEIPVGDRGGEYDGQQDEVIFAPSVAPSSIDGVKSEIDLQSCSGAGDGAKLKAGLTCDHNIFSFSSKKLVDAAAATVARRRRKELTRLKNLHGRQCRTNC
ncbi:unnamed protein product [Linum tenue]|uniref:BZIP domain-containing protein n=1 Tax=Linum tenue TaxID=586396 RepID=A0AAV0JFU3_9ROSI|nr:unnamed protein product [Linum tenue]